MATSGTAQSATRNFGRRLAERIGHRTYDMWFGQTTKLHVEGQRVRVATDSRFVADWIDGHFRQALDATARDTLGRNARVDLRVAPDLFGKSDGQPRTAAPRRRRPRPLQADRLRRLDDFVTGVCNRLAFAAAERIAAGADRAGSPLFVHGACGVGKTHLLQGIVRRARQRHDAAARYLTAEQFTNEYISSVRSNSLDAFRKRTRTLDLLAIDEVHFLANKTATQREFQHTIDAIELAGARVVLAADEHPLRLGVKAALSSRFVAGMVTTIERPDRETRLLLARRLAAARGLRLAEPAAQAVATRSLGSVRELEGTINKLAALQLVAEQPGREIGLLLIERAFAEDAWRPRSPLHIDAVIDTVCRRLVVNQADLLASGRHRRVVAARGLVAYLARSLTSMSYPEIAQALGRRHHSTIHTAVARTSRQIAGGQRVEVGEQGRTVSVSDLVDQLRHELLQTG